MPEIGPATDRLRQATTLIDLRRYQEATAILGQVIASDPAAAPPRCLLARCRLGLNDAAGALEAASAAVAVQPDAEWGHRLRSIALNRLKRNHESLAAAKEAVRLAPLEFRAYLALADAEVSNRHLDEAEMAGRRVLALAPDRAEGYNTLGLVALRRDRPMEAEPLFRSALARNPENALAMNNLGVALLRQHQRSQAIHYFAEASRLDPSLSLYRRNAVHAAKAGMVAVACLVVLIASYAVSPALNAFVWFGIVVAIVVMSVIRARTVGAKAVLRRFVTGRPPNFFRRSSSASADPRASRALIRQLRREKAPPRPRRSRGG